MEMPLASAAKRGWTFIFVPMTIEFPPQGPSDSMYCRMRGPAVEADPASARPKPSKIVFLPRTITFSGMSSYFVFTINSETYLVTPGALGKSSAGFANASAGPPRSANPTRARDVLQKSRRIMGDHLLDRLQPVALLVVATPKPDRLKPVLLTNPRDLSKAPGLVALR